ncbi:MAG: methylated-DNA--[protein]-cysteine S-methyltransferase [Pseudomonadota bacterium]
MNTINVSYFETPYGELIMGSYDSQLCLCDWRYRKRRSAIDKRIRQALQASFVEKMDATLQLTMTQLTEYFTHRRQTFTVPLLLLGTEFQNRVWQCLLTLPFGQTITYATLAEKLGNKQAVRAVASANGANAHSIIVPCHRIIGSDGNLTGYAGGLSVKAKLLQLESNGMFEFAAGTPDLDHHQHRID